MRHGDRGRRLSPTERAEIHRPPLHVLVIGAGMYTSGRGTAGYGTILPALYEGWRQGLVAQITIVARDWRKRDEVLQKAQALGQLMGLDVPVEYFPQGDESGPDPYLGLIATGHYDCAVVAIPDHLHFEVISSLLRRHLHCLVVKPLVPHLHQLDQLLALQAQAGVYGAVDFHKRFDETNLRIRKMLSESAIGDVLYVLVEYSQRRTIPLEHFRAWSELTNIFQYLGVHYADLIYFLTGALPVRLTATGQRNLLPLQGVETYDAIQALIEWKLPGTEKCFTSAILTNWIDPQVTTAMSDQKIKLIGTAGRIECDQKERGLKLISDRCGIEDINPYFSDLRYHVEGHVLEFRGYGFETLMQFVRDCYALKQGTQRWDALRGLRATFQDARVSTAVIEAVNASLAGGGAWVRLNPSSGHPEVG